MPYSEISNVCSENHIKHTNTPCGQKAEFVNVKPGGTVTYPWALKGKDGPSTRSCIWGIRWRDKCKHTRTHTATSRLPCGPHSVGMFFICSFATIYCANIIMEGNVTLQTTSDCGLSNLLVPNIANTLPVSCNTCVYISWWWCCQWWKRVGLNQGIILGFL
jgi:hypothetical protein